MGYAGSCNNSMSAVLMMFLFQTEWQEHNEDEGHELERGRLGLSPDLLRMEEGIAFLRKSTHSRVRSYVPVPSRN